MKSQTLEEIRNQIINLIAGEEDTIIADLKKIYGEPLPEPVLFFIEETITNLAAGDSLGAVTTINLALDYLG